MRAYLFLIVLGATWGLYFSIIKVAVESNISYWNILLFSSLLVAIGLFTISLVRKRLPRLSKRNIIFFIVCSILSYLIPFVLEMFSADNLPASVLTLIVTTTPVFTFFIAAIVKTDSINSTRIFGVVSGLVATCLILFPATLVNIEISFFWVSIALIIPIAYGLHENYVTKFWPDDSDSMQIATGEAILALAIMLPAYLYYADPMTIAEGTAIGISAVITIALMGLLDIYLYFELIRTKGPVFTSQASYITAFTGVIWGMIIFDERPDIWVCSSAVFLIIGLFLIHRGGVQINSVRISNMSKP